MTIEAVATMTTKELQSAYAEMFGKATTNRNKKRLAEKIKKAVAERGEMSAPVAATIPVPSPIVVETPPAKLKRKAAIKTAPVVGKNIETRVSGARIPVLGEVLIHTYRKSAGKPPCKATVVEGGFRYKGKVHATMGEIAKLDSGIAWNGVLFFKLAPFPKHAARKPRAKGKP